MDDQKHHYLYSCRECSVRQRCIEGKQLSPGIRLTIARAFESHTDTLEMWELLQQDCLLAREAREQAARKKPATSALVRRLRRARQPVEEEPATPPPAPPPEPVIEPEAEPVLPVEPVIPPSAPRVEPTLPIAEAEPVPRRREAKPKPAPPTKVLSFGLVVASTQRWVRLPVEGTLVLGRCESGLGSPADVDLTYDERGVQSVSRHHARLTGRGNQHWIEDMGSTNGTFLNDRRLPMGEKVQLAPGDKIMLGRCLLTYQVLPDWVAGPDVRVPHIAILTLTHTGYHIRLPARSPLVLGRPDPAAGYTPDVDLSNAGDMARHVSRRHARLTARGGLHFIEDIGSTIGTRLNGQVLRMGDPPALLHPGDQVWLGGCVVAYEWKLS